MRKLNTIILLILVLLISTFIISNNNETTINGNVTGLTRLYIKKDLAIANFIVTDNERILLTIKTHGGSSESMKSIAKMIKASEVPVDTYVSEYASSAGAIAFILGDKRYVDKDAQIMFHGAHLGTYALTEVTLQRAADLLETGELEQLLFLRKTSALVDIDMKTYMALEVAVHFEQETGLSGLKQTILSTLQSMKASNKMQVQTVTDQLQKIDSRYTYDVVKEEFFANFEKDVYFSGQQLIDMGIAKEFKGEK